MINLEILSTIIFFAIVGLLLLKDRKKIEFNYGIIIRRWYKGRKLIDKIIKKHVKLVRRIGTFAVIIGFMASLAGVFLLVACGFFPEKLGMPKGCFRLVIPSVGGYQYPGPVLSIPFWYWIVGVFVLIASHETMHAIYSRLAKIPIKSYGILFFLVLPIGAFVDPDMNRVKKLKPIKKLRIYAAGSFGNFVVALLVILIAIVTMSIVNYFVEDAGVTFVSTLPNTPAERIGLSGIIYQMDNQIIKNRTEFSSTLSKMKPGENITIFTTTGKFELELTEHPENPNVPYIGISYVRTALKYKYLFTGYVSDNVVNALAIWNTLLFWLTLLNIGIGVVNLLPMKPFDGGYMYEVLFNKLFKNRGKDITYVSSIVVLGLILFNLFLVF